MPGRFYVITRLYNVNDRLASLFLCEQIDKLIDEGSLPGFVRCYLPYRDSDAVLSPDEVDVGGAIFNLDIQTMKKECSGIIGYFDGAGYDSGCGFEIGLAHSYGYPVHIITTDFMSWSVGDSSSFYKGSRLLEGVAKIAALSDSNPSITDYRIQQEDLRDRSIEAMKANLIQDFCTVTPQVPLAPLPIQYDYYLDPNFKFTEGGRYLQDQIIRILQQKSKSYIIGDNKKVPTETIDELRQSGQAIFYGDVFEHNIDSSILQGIAYGIGRPSVMFCSNMQRYHDSRLINYKNVMITCSSATIASSLDALNHLI